MKQSNVLGFTGALLFSAIWTVPLVRAFIFWRAMQTDFSEFSSVGSSNDLAFSKELLTSNIISLMASWVVLWCLSRRSSPAYLIPISLIAFVAIEVIRLQPEEVIVFIPSIWSLLPVLLSLFAGLIAAIIYFVLRNRPEDPKSTVVCISRGL